MTELQLEKPNWQLFFAQGNPNSKAQEQLQKLEPPPWRRFGDINKLNDSQKQEIETRWSKLQELSKTNEKAIKRGQSFYISETAQDVINAVNAAIYLRRPILVTGKPGSGKTSLAYAIAYELGLGNVLTWAINARTTLQNGLYRYDAIARLQDTQSGDAKGKGIGEYIKLGALGTAFLPSFLPRVLLIDEIDKCDLNLPNDLLNLFEEGEFEIEELIRQASKKESNSQTESEDSTKTKTENQVFRVYTNDSGIKANITQGKVSCYAFPIIIMTSNGERDFPPAFKRRCIRVRMPDPDSDALNEIVKAHFTEKFFTENESEISELVTFFNKDNKSENLATDQLLNIIYLLTREVKIKDNDRDSLKDMLCKRLNLMD